MLNPNSFKSEEELQKAMLQDGLRRGWKPMFADFPISKKVSAIGKQMVDKILRR
jgi:hypothetical protein